MHIARATNKTKNKNNNYQCHVVIFTGKEKTSTSE
jgi:hypothetical protein